MEGPDGGIGLIEEAPILGDGVIDIKENGLDAPGIGGA
jgi:hypothetical protein